MIERTENIISDLYRHKDVK